MLNTNTEVNLVLINHKVFNSGGRVCNVSTHTSEIAIACLRNSPQERHAMAGRVCVYIEQYTHGINNFLSH